MLTLIALALLIALCYTKPWDNECTVWYATSAYLFVGLAFVFLLGAAKWVAVALRHVNFNTFWELL